ncbi:LysR family transcriptional regulator [Ensifer sp. ENS11]|uniref:LysR family transcriptional regulator n=1 Tax=Ensifer sp. ENS11 TaxID=2769291 RepID=UPI001785E306|nr:LysR family transcriptional regulator [Ensifer sp. ENS11]MBD9489261.1 LysR family transcriptional regulator [Ensifer sp. ENS11]
MNRSGLIELEAVVAVARRGGFRAAARDLGMSSSALSHAVAGLEARLGVRLFDRTTRSVSLSAAGEQFIAEVAPALSQIHAAIENVDQHRERPSGTLRLNTSLGAARMILSPLILEYLRRHPEMKVELVTDNRLIDLVEEGFDAGFRLQESLSADMIAVPFSRTIRSIVVGSPAYFAGREQPRVPADLLRHVCIRMRMSSGSIYRWEFEKRGETVEIDVPGVLTLDETALMHEAVLAGVGLLLITEDLVAEDLAARRLIQVLDDWTPAYPGLSLYYPGRRHAPAKLRAFIDLVKERSR